MKLLIVTFNVNVEGVTTILLWIFAYIDLPQRCNCDQICFNSYEGVIKNLILS
jgi:hypothetical protein